jgi:hypothetical protein
MSYPLRVVHDLRPALPWTIYALPFAIEHGPDPAALEHRFAILWDEDNDERILAAVLDVYYRHPQALENIYAAGEHKGSLSIWAATFPIADQSAWAAASRGPAIQDSWPVQINLYSETKRTGGLQNSQMMGEDEAVRKFPSEHDQLNWLIKLFDLGPSAPRREW